MLNSDSEIPDLLERVAKILSGNAPLMVKGFGILLLGKDFDDKLDNKEPEDPTDAILGRKVGGLGSDEMIPRL